MWIPNYFERIFLDSFDLNPVLFPNLVLDLDPVLALEKLIKKKGKKNFRENLSKVKY